MINEIFIQLNPSILPKNHWIYENDHGQGRIVSELCHFIDLSNFFMMILFYHVVNLIKNSPINTILIISNEIELSKKSKL